MRIFTFSLFCIGYQFINVLSIIDLSVTIVVYFNKGMEVII